MLPDRVSNPGPLTYESGALPIALPGPAINNAVSTSEQRYDIASSVMTMLWRCIHFLPKWGVVKSEKERRENRHYGITIRTGRALILRRHSIPRLNNHSTV